MHGVRGRPGVVGRAHDFEGASPLGGDARIFEIASPESRKVGGEDRIPNEGDWTDLLFLFILLLARSGIGRWGHG